MNERREERKTAGSEIKKEGEKRKRRKIEKRREGEGKE